MIGSYEVGAVFRIVNDASPTLERIAAQFRELNLAIDATKKNLASLGSNFGLSGLSAEIGRLNEQFFGLGAAAREASAAMKSSFVSVDAGANSALASMRALKAEMAEVGAASRAIGAAGLASGLGSRRTGGGGHGGGPGGLSFGGPSAALPGGFHAHVRNANAALAGLGILGYGAYLEGEVEDQAARMLLTGQIATPGGMRQSDIFQTIRKTLQGISLSTGYGPKEVGEAMLTVERQFGGLPFSQRLKVEETLAPFAAAEARMKETGFKESFEALVGLAHMTGTYDVGKLPELMREFSYTSMITPVSIGQFQKAISYSLPMLHAGLDMDPASVMFLTAMTQTAGITNTKSGTWLRSFFENAEPRIGAAKSDLAHNEALRRMGLLGLDNHVTWQVLGPAGKTDWDASILKLSDTINRFTQSTDAAERLGLIKQAFGERGGGEASLMNLTEFIKQFGELQEKMRSFQGGSDVVSYLAENSPAQQFRQAWADAQNVLMDIGSVALPSVTSGLKDLDTVLKAAKAFSDKLPSFHSFSLGRVAADLGLVTAGLWGLGKAAAAAKVVLGLGLPAGLPSARAARAAGAVEEGAAAVAGGAGLSRLFALGPQGIISRVATLVGMELVKSWLDDAPKPLLSPEQYKEAGPLRRSIDDARRRKALPFESGFPDVLGPDLTRSINTLRQNESWFGAKPYAALRSAYADHWWSDVGGVASNVDREMAFEARRGKALGSLPTAAATPPPANITVTPAPVTLHADIKSSPVTLNMDGRAIAAAVVTYVMAEVKSMLNFSGHGGTQIHQPATPEGAGAFGGT